MALYWIARRTYRRSASLLNGESIDPQGKPRAVAAHST